MLTPADVVAAKLIVQLGLVGAEAVRGHVAAVDADPSNVVDLIARLGQTGLVDSAAVTRLRRYVALFEHVRREAIYLKMVEKQVPQLSKEAIGELIARIEQSDYRTRIASILVARGVLDEEGARNLERKTRKSMRREDLAVLERYRAQGFSGVKRPLVKASVVDTQVFRVSGLFRSRETLARVDRAKVRLALEAEGPAAPPPEREAQFEFIPAQLDDSSWDDPATLTEEQRKILEQMDTSRLKARDVQAVPTARYSAAQAQAAAAAAVEGEDEDEDEDEDEVEVASGSTEEQIGPYRIVECIGQGGMGAVYLGQQDGYGPIVAVKTLLTDKATAEHVARFKREAHISSLLDHPNAIRLLDEGVTEEGVSYMVIPFFTGRDLKAILDEGGTLELEDAFHYLEQILAGLEAVHQAGAVHRDMKPENVFVIAGPERQAKVVDLGIARLMDDDKPADQRAFRSRAGVVSGTPAYIAPESITDDPIDQRTDIYSVGILFFELLTGKNPLFAETPYDYLREHLVGVPLTLFQGRKDRHWHPELEGLVARMLAKDRADRPASCQAILDELAGGLRERALEHHRNPPPPKDEGESGVFNSFFKMFR